jgi:methionyl-tRNA synthetase
MTEKILIAVAWPYANGFLHLGHIAGSELPADIFARYHRARGNQVLMVSGSDQHGTPITLKAEEEGKTPNEIVARYHAHHLDTWAKLGISYDLYTSTGTANHAAVTQDIFLTLLNKGYIYKASMSQPFCPKCDRFLPDRYVEGTCPHCHFINARGDQCDQCGKPLNAAELVAPRCRVCATMPEFRESEHFFLKLIAFQQRLEEWIRKQTHWRQNVLNFSLGYLTEGLKDRPITRDINWGIPVPVPGFESKRIYVWFEAVIGYLSASKEWAAGTANPEAWRSFWEGDAKGYYFLGKDNIVFHSIIWPSMLMGYGGLNLPADVPANEYLTFENKKGSKSRNWAVWVPDYTSRYDPDPLRYFLAANMPETSDTDFNWHEFIRRNNDELVATYGNLVNRVLTFAYRNFDGMVPTPAELDNVAGSMLERAEATLNTVGELLHDCHFREAMRTAMSLAQEANRFLDEKAPWKTIKVDRSAAATSLWVAIGVISDLKPMLYPFLPFSSQRVHEFLGFAGTVEATGWKSNRPTPGQKMVPPEPLFAKLDEKLADEEAARLGQPTL